ncbi:NAD-dependent epimerase/dehydratase family protein [Streptomyces ortus]|uniref:NAD-dependent epimerase/dehydratase family protein n=1 Tax=Streptomyces ortus TaxID=2867268 RepID=A0ABT3VGJ2_9ACTN|nr:NAD-dependent epimerase/dehydratase family protein [Streptomyces ortus]MCX4238803.1 NAD-dependent epimerase/dehydratase family protein [Streptomyces ortus]
MSTRRATAATVVGRGFLAHSLAPVAERHPDTVILAAGVSLASTTAPELFAREAALLDDTIEACRAEGRRLLFFSTSSTGMYGGLAGPGREDDQVVPGTPYARHKLALEQRLRTSGADHLILRLSHVVGPRQPSHQLLPTLVRQLREGLVQIHLRATRDLIGVADVVTVVDRLLALDLRGTVVNVASGAAVPVADIVDHLERVLGLDCRREFRDTGSGCTVSVERLRALVPEVAGLGFGPGYHRGVLDAYAASLDTSPHRAER